MKSARLFLAVISAFCVFAAAQDQAPKSAGLSANPVYKKNCAKCHGDTAEGRHFRGPSLISAKVSAVSNDDLRSIITNGKGHMPKFAGKIPTSDIDAMVEQIKAGIAK